MARHLMTCRTGDERGATSAEYAAMIVLIAAVVATLASTVVPQVSGRVGPALCRVFQGDCRASGDGGDTASANGDQNGSGRNGEGRNTPVGPGAGAEPAGDGGGSGRGRTNRLVGFVSGVGSWLLPGTPETNPGRANGREVRDLLDEWDWGLGEERDWDDLIEEINDLLTSDRGADYNGEFFRALGASHTLGIFRYAFFEYDANHDGVLSESEMERAREELGPLAARLGDAIRQGTSPASYRNDLLNGDPVGLALLIDIHPTAFPPTFVNAAAQNILEDPMDPRLGNDPGLQYEVQIRAIHALGQNPVASQLFLQGEGNVDLLATVSGDERKPRYIADVFDAALGYDEGGAGHQRALGNIIEAGEDGRYWFLSGDQYTEARQVLAESLHSYLPYMSHIGQPNAGYEPGDAPQVQLDGVSYDEMTEFLGALQDDPEARDIITGMAQRYTASVDPLSEITPDTRLGDTGPFQERVHEVAGLFTVVTEGQNQAHLTAMERRDSALAAYDAFTGLVQTGLSAVPMEQATGVGVDVTLGRLIDEHRNDLSDALTEDVESNDVSHTVTRLIAGWTGDVEQRLREQYPDATDEEITATAGIVTEVYRGSMLDVMRDALDDADGS